MSFEVTAVSQLLARECDNEVVNQSLSMLAPEAGNTGHMNQAAVAIN